MMEGSQGPDSLKLSDTELVKIKAEVKQAAIEHLNTKDAVTAISHFTDDAIAVSNNKIFSSLEALAGDIKAYYKILKEVNLAVWDEMYIRVINRNAALVTAKFRYSFTSTDDEKTDLQGVWTALYVCRSGGSKIRARHELFSPLKDK